MATEEGISNAIGCMATVFPQFLAMEIARLTDEIVSATQAITDPLAAVAGTNVQGMVDDVASLAEGSIVESLGAAAVGLADSYARRQIQERLEEMALANPNAVKKIQQSRNIGEQVLANSMLMFSLAREAPFVVAQRMCERVVKLCDLKIAQLKCMKSHVVQMNNSVAVLAKAKNEIVNFDAQLEIVAKELDNAKSDLRTAAFKNADGTIGFNENAIARAVQNLKDADAALSPKGGALNLLDVANILTSGTVSSSQTTESNIKLASMALPHLNFLLDAEMAAVTKVNEAINFNINGVFGVLNSFRSSAVSDRSAEIRLRTIKALCVKIETVKRAIDEALNSSSTRSKTNRSLLWSSQIKSIASAADKMQSTSFDRPFEDGDVTGRDLANAYNLLVKELNSINSSNVSNGIESTFNMKVLITSLRKSGDKLFQILDDRAPTDAELLNFTVLVAQAATGGSSLIDESTESTIRVKEACQTFADRDIGFRRDYDKLGKLFDALGFDRGKDLLDSGKFEEFFDSTLDKLSYVNTAISCLTDAINGVDDEGTKIEITELRDELQSERSNQLLSSADNLNFGATRILDTAKAELQRFQQKVESAKGLATKLEELAERLGFAVDGLGQGFDEMTANLERIEIDANGRLSADLDEFIKRPGAGVPICL